MFHTQSTGILLLFSSPSLSKSKIDERGIGQQEQVQFYLLSRTCVLLYEKLREAKTVILLNS